MKYALIMLFHFSPESHIYFQFGGPMTWEQCRAIVTRIDQQPSRLVFTDFDGPARELDAACTPAKGTTR
ncbi:hypothetical protein [Maritalea porphyrae]|uniref:hypothetical protein n=1 Tax=Maritalea porphyrae TaxID=880732 RepID=UPI0022AFE327|nr:hypothetical protein [Maritalea porphyrae]MCZ4270743.1 hypothetical protein [Maritalea porphyrae]